MRAALFGILVTIVSMASMPSARADAWSRYDNARFGYSIAIPPGFSDVTEAANGDGGVSSSADGRAELSVWGNYLVTGDFESEVAERVRSDASDGWAITYDRRTARNASWSGSKDGRVLYARSVRGCDDSAIHFRLIYDSSDLRAYDATVRRLVKSLHADCG